jgi:REP element-mobilizing transposase RayT
MGRSRYTFHENHYPYFITCSVAEGISLFANPSITEILLQSIDYLQTQKQLTVYAYVVMHNHVHMIVKGDNLADEIRKFKSFTARSAIDFLKQHRKTFLLSQLKAYKLSHHKDSEYQVWQEGVHPKQISTADMMRQKIEYIHFNPVKAGFIDSPLYWRYSSVHNYKGNSGIIPVTLFSG